MDWRHPDDHPDITLAVAYSKATGTSKGLLLSNPGGPGADGLDCDQLPGRRPGRGCSATTTCSASTRAASVQQHGPACTTSADAYDALPSVDDPRVRSRKAHAAELAAAKLYAQGLREGRVQPVRRHPADRLRPGVPPPADRPGRAGVRQAQLHRLLLRHLAGRLVRRHLPEHTGRFILDSNMNWTASMYANQVDRLVLVPAPPRQDVLSRGSPATTATYAWARPRRGGQGATTRRSGRRSSRPTAAATAIYRPPRATTSSRSRCTQRRFPRRGQHHPRSSRPSARGGRPGGRGVRWPPRPIRPPAAPGRPAICARPGWRPDAPTRLTTTSSIGGADRGRPLQRHRPTRAT